MKYNQHNQYNQIICGDCLEIMKDLPNKSIDLCLTDPPYGTTACSWDSVIPLELMWKQLKRIVKLDGAIVLFGSQPFTSVLITSNLKMFRYCWVWHKTRPSNFPLAKKQPMKYHEDIAVFGVNSPRYFPQMVKGNRIRKKGKNDGYRGFNKGLENPIYLDKEYKDFYPSSIQTFSHHNQGLLHPTQKPIDLFKYLIKTYSKEGELVLDFAIGSGTTAIAAIETKRNYIGIDKESKYCKITCERILQAKKSPKLFDL